MKTIVEEIISSLSMTYDLNDGLVEDSTTNYLFFKSKSHKKMDT